MLNQRIIDALFIWIFASKEHGFLIILGRKLLTFESRLFFMNNLYVVHREDNRIDSMNLTLQVKFCDIWSEE